MGSLILDLMMLIFLTTTTLPCTCHATRTIEEGGGDDLSSSSYKSSWNSNEKNDKRVIDVKGGPESVIWVVQLSDLHFSVHHPERALDFKTLVGPVLSVIKPSLVLITGDLTGLLTSPSFSLLLYFYVCPSISL